MSTPVTIPLLNPNEPEALLAAVHVREGQRVTIGSPLCTLETTKSTAEVEAEVDGYVAGLAFEAGEAVRAGDLLCYLAPDPDWEPPRLESSPELVAGEEQTPPEGLRITRPALALARRHGLDLRRLPLGPLVTEEQVQDLLPASSSGETAIQSQAYAPPAAAFDAGAIIVYGGGGHGKSVIDMLRTLGTYHIAGIVDDGISAGEVIMGLPVLGGGEVLASLHAQGIRLAVNAVGGIGNVSVRIQVFQRLAQAGFAFPSLVHPTAFVEASARLGSGVQVFPHAYVGSQVEVGFGCILNTGSIVSHDCTLEDYVNISPGGILAGGVRVGPAALVGMGATINLGVHIGAGARIGNGATIKSDVPDMQPVKAGSIWPPN